mmetsp:Transcript_19496/g.43924  ORF Transcript_19496/g.43924 Transcript_19496/m.43924 type:complete len:351 (-) Transcript_19496:649-1701(-)
MHIMEERAALCHPNFNDFLTCVRKPVSSPWYVTPSAAPSRTSCTKARRFFMACSYFFRFATRAFPENFFRCLTKPRFSKICLVAHLRSSTSGSGRSCAAAFAFKRSAAFASLAALFLSASIFAGSSSSSSSSSHSSSSSSRLACGPFSSSNAESALEALFRALGATLSSALTGLAFAACSCIRLCTSPISACSVADGLHWPSVGSAISSCSSSTAFALLVFFFIAGSLSKSPVDGIAPDILLSSSFAGCAGLERRICSTRSRRVAFAGGADDKASLVGFLSSLLLAGFTPTSFICRLTFVTFCACFTAFLSCGSNFLSIVANFSCSSRSHTNCATTGCARTGAPSARKSK